MADSLQDILIFEVANRRYGLPAAQVAEIIRAVALIPLPQAPAVVEGVINVRGAVVPVLNLRARFRLPNRPLAPADQFLIAWAGSRRVALWVDRAVELVRLSLPETPTISGVVPGAEYVSWIAVLPEELLLIHDLETFLSRGELKELDETLPTAAALLELAKP